MMYDYDFVVIGSGPAGRKAAIQAAKAGKSVLVIEKSPRIGGVSVHTGTIPSKTIRETALNLSGWRERGFYGKAYKAKSDISASDLRHRLMATLNHEVDVLEHQFLRNKVDYLTGTARFLSKNSLEITCLNTESKEITFSRALIAVGTQPYRPDHIPFDGRKILDSDEILDIQELPSSITIIGAGVIGVEYATILSTLNVKVTIIEARDTFLDFVDQELIAAFQYELHDRGVTFRLGCKVEKITNQGDSCYICLSDGRIVKSKMVLYTAGRIGAVEQLNLDACNLQADNRGRLIVNKKTYQTTEPHIYAAGDIIGFPSLASTSMEQGRLAACHAFSIPKPATPKHFPYGIYSVPEISMIGMTEQQLKEQNIPYECGTAYFRETARGQIMGLTNGKMKMLFALGNKRLLGVHILGEGATELIHIGQAVISLEGTLDFFINNVFNFPTLAEAYKVAALDAWNRMQIHEQIQESETAVA